jgi:hypothetical protein
VKLTVTATNIGVEVRGTVDTSAEFKVIDTFSIPIPAPVLK